MVRRNCKFGIVAAVLFGLVLFCGAGPRHAAAQENLPETGLRPAETQQETLRWDLAFAIAISIGVSCLGAGYAVGKVGAAALGAASEKPELLTRSLLFVALAEGIAIYGLLIAVLLWVKF